LKNEPTPKKKHKETKKELKLWRLPKIENSAEGRSG
jgi:hypothetical protein